MKVIRYKILITVMLFAASLQVCAQQDWELSKDKNGIKVYTRKADSSKFKSVKVEAVLEGSLDKLASILMGVEKNIKWVYGTKSLHLIKRNSANELIYYAETGLPWPMRNRDQAILINLYPDSAGHKLKITTTGKPMAIPPTEGLVRVPYFLGVWDVTAVDNKRIAINYFLDVDPGGSIPAWITNMFVAKGPYETFMNLSGLLIK